MQAAVAAISAEVAEATAARQRCAELEEAVRQAKSSVESAAAEGATELGSLKEQLAAKNASAAEQREAMEALMRYDYPGNVRELQNMVERAVVMARGNSVWPKNSNPDKFSSTITVQEEVWNCLLEGSNSAVTDVKRDLKHFTDSLLPKL